MNRPTDLQTHDFDLMAAIMAETGIVPTVYQQPGQPLVTCETPLTDETQQIAIGYATGDLLTNARRFAACRSWLYRKAKDCGRERI